MEHCCKELDTFLKDVRLPLNYNPRMREYSLKYKDGLSVQIMNFCPFCGGKFPESLRDKFYDEIFDAGYEGDDDKNLPSEYRSDAWWKKQGL